MEYGENFVDDVKINRFQLEKEAESQPGLFYYYSNQLAVAKTDRDKLEDLLKLTRATMELDIRSNPTKYLGNDIKVTEGSVSCALEPNKEVADLRLKLQKANSTIYHLEAATKSLEHRKSEIDNLVQLWIKGYYATPDGGKKTVGDDVAKATRNALNKK